MDIRTIVQALVIAFAVVSCDDGYVPLEERISWQECEQIGHELSELLIEVFPSNDFEVVNMRSAVRAWIRPDREDRYKKIKEAINLCSIKQTFKERIRNQRGIDYDAMYVSLVTLDVTVRQFLEDIESEKPLDWMRWRSNAVREIVKDLKSSLKRS